MKRASQLRRLCTLRVLEEQHRASLLANAKQRLREVEVALEKSGEQRHEGKTLVRRSVSSSTVEDRVAGLEEIDAAVRKASAVLALKGEVENLVRQLRESFLSKRMERRQAEGVLDFMLRKEARNAERRSQSDLDEWYRTANRRPESAASADE